CPKEKKRKRKKSPKKEIIIKGVRRNHPENLPRETPHKRQSSQPRISRLLRPQSQNLTKFRKKEKKRGKQ
ncbi:unnamed protein product, partial [Sphagnum troendelagicum]